MGKQYGTRVDAPIVAGNDDSDDIASAIARQIKGNFQRFPDIDSRNTWTKSYPSRLDETTCLVMSDTNGEVSWYTWDSSNSLWDEFEPMENDDLKQAIADVAQQVAALPKTGGVSFTAEAPLKLAEKGGGKSVLSLDHEAFEPHHSEAYLAYMDYGEVVIGKAAPIEDRAGSIWADSVAWGSNNVNLYAERNTKSVILQDPLDDDPNVTGGYPIFCGLHLGLTGKAPDDGTIEVFLYDAFHNKLLENSKGNPIGVVRHYTAGDDLKALTVAQVYVAKGAVKGQWRVRHTFTDDPVKLKDWAAGASCVFFQDLAKGETVSPAMNEFQEVVGKPIRIMQKYFGKDFLSNTWELGFDAPSTVLQPGQGSDSVLGVDFENSTEVKVVVSDGLINIKDNATPAMFNSAMEMDTEDVEALAGKEVTVSAEVFNRYNAVNLCMFTYTGDLDKINYPVLTGTSNDQYILASGWDKHDSQFMAVHVEGGFHQLSKTFTIPHGAKKVMFGILPNTAEAPMDISIKPITLDVVNPFTAYEISLPTAADALYYTNAESQFVSYSKIWAIGTSNTNLPFGEHPSHMKNTAPVKLFAVEDDANMYKGGIILEAVTQYKIEIWLNVGNYYKKKSGKDTTLTFWVANEDGDIIADSTKTLTIKDGDFSAHLANWTFDYECLTANTKLSLIGMSSVEGMYLFNGSYNAAGVSVQGKVFP